MNLEKSSSTFKVVKPSGILDSTQTKKLRNEVDAILSSGIYTILIDLENITFMDSSGLGALVIVLKSVRTAGGQLYLCSMNSQIQMLFELTSMYRVFKTCKDQAEFYEQVKIYQ